MIFNFMITDWKSDILCLSETWLRPSSTVDTHLTQENFTLFRRDRPSRSHGGLLVYVCNHVQVRRRPDLELRELECITLELRPRLHEDDVKTIGTKSYLSGKKSFRIGLLFTRRRSVSANF